MSNGKGNETDFTALTETLYGNDMPKKKQTRRENRKTRTQQGSGFAGSDDSFSQIPSGSLSRLKAGGKVRVPNKKHMKFKHTDNR